MNNFIKIKLRLGEVESGVFNKTLDQLGWVIIPGRILNNFSIIKLRLGEVKSGVFNKSLDHLGWVIIVGIKLGLNYLLFYY